MYTIPGHHHISMITKNAKINNHFYQKVLGLRRVKKTVNQDNPIYVSFVLWRFNRECGNRIVIF